MIITSRSSHHGMKQLESGFTVPVTPAPSTGTAQGTNRKEKKHDYNNQQI
jgi:hypothetical protein